MSAWDNISVLPGPYTRDALESVGGPILRDAKRAQIPDAYAAPVFVNNWTNYSTAYAPVGYLLTPDGFVSVRGLALRASGTPAVNEVMFTLPLGLRPSATLPFCVTTGDAGAISAGRVDVRSTGEVTWITGTATAGQSYMSLNLPLFRPV